MELRTLSLSPIPFGPTPSPAKNGLESKSGLECYKSGSMKGKIECGNYIHCCTVFRVLMVQEADQVLLETLERQVPRDSSALRVHLETLELMAVRETLDSLGHQDHREVVDHPDSRETRATPDLRDRPDHRDSEVQ